MAIPDDELAAALRAVLRMTTGFYVGLAGILEVGQLENLNYWVESKDHTGATLWQKDDMPLEEAIGHFLRIRKEREVGYDIEVDLNPGLGHIGPRRAVTPTATRLRSRPRADSTTHHATHLECGNSRKVQLVRKTLSFSKCPRNHLGALWYFIRLYNRSCRCRT